MDGTMKSLCVAGLLIFGLFIGGPGNLRVQAFSVEKAPSTATLHDSWREIAYPSVLVKWNGREDRLHITVRNRYEGESDKLKVILSCSSPQDRQDFIDPAQIKVSL